MSLTIASGDVLAVKMIFQVPAQANAFNILHYQIGSITGTPPDLPTGLGTIGQAVYDAFKSAWAAIADATCSLRIVQVSSEWPLPRSVSWNYVPGSPQMGAVASSEPMPAQDSITVVKRTGVGQRWGIGRVYLVGFAESQHEDGKLTAGALANVNTLAGKYDDHIVITAAGWGCTLSPVLFSKTKPPVVTARITPILSTATSDDIFKHQKRRRPGKGI